MAGSCKKFEPNCFNQSKCQHCFQTREQHGQDSGDCSKELPRVSKFGYLFIAPEHLNFSNEFDRSKRWQRRFFILYENGSLTYSLDENSGTVPQGAVELSECVEVRLAEEETGHAHSLALVTAVSHTTYIKGASRDEIARWQDAMLLHKQRLSRPPAFRSHSIGESYANTPAKPASGGAERRHTALVAVTSAPAQTAVTGSAGSLQSSSTASSGSVKFADVDEIEPSRSRSRTRVSRQTPVDVVSDAVDGRINKRNSAMAALYSFKTEGRVNGRGGQDSVSAGDAALTKGSRDAESAYAEKLRAAANSRYGEAESRRAKSVGRPGFTVRHSWNATDDIKAAMAAGTGVPKVSSALFSGTSTDSPSADELSSQRRGWLYLHDPTEAEWKKFWFVLDGSTLQYSKDQFETQPKFIDLTQSTTVSESESDRNYSFLVQGQQGKFELAAVTGGMRGAWIEAIRTASKNSLNSPVPTLHDLHKLPAVSTSSSSSMKSEAVVHRRTVESSRAMHKARDPLRYQSCPTSLNNPPQQQHMQPVIEGQLSQSVENIVETAERNIAALPEQNAAGSVAVIRESNVEADVVLRESTEGMAVSVVQRRKKKSNRMHATNEKASRTKTWSGAEFAALKESLEESDDSQPPSSRRHAMEVCIEIPEQKQRHRSPSARVRERSNSKTRTRSPPPPAEQETGTTGNEDGSKRGSHRRSRERDLKQASRNQRQTKYRQSSSCDRGPRIEKEIATVVPQKDANFALADLLETQVDCLKQKLEEKEAECAKLHATENDLRTQLLSLHRSHQRSLSDLDTDQNCYISQISEISDRMSQVSEDHAVRLQDVRLQHQKEMSGVREELSQVKQSASKKDALLLDLQGKLLAAVTALGDAKQALQRSMRELQAERDKSQQLADEKDNAIQKLAAANETATHSQAEAAQTKERVRQLEADLERLRLELLGAREEVGARNKEYQQLRGEQNRRNSTKEISTAHTTHLEQTPTAVKQNSLATVASDLKSSSTSTDSFVAKLKDKLQESQEEIQRLRDSQVVAAQEHEKQLSMLEEQFKRNADKSAKEICQLTAQRDARRQEAMDAKLKLAEMEQRVKQLELELAWKDDDAKIVGTDNDRGATANEEIKNNLANLDAVKLELTNLQSVHSVCDNEKSELREKLLSAEKQTQSSRDIVAREMLALKEAFEKEKIGWQNKLQEVELQTSRERNTSISEMNALQVKCADLQQQASIADALVVSLTKAVHEKEALLDEHVKVLLNKDVDIGQLRETVARLTEQKAAAELRLGQYSDKLAARESELKQLKEATDKLIELKTAGERRLLQCADKLSSCEAELKKAKLDLSRQEDLKQATNKLSEDYAVLRTALRKIAANLLAVKELTVEDADVSKVSEDDSENNVNSHRTSEDRSRDKLEIDRAVEESSLLIQAMQDVLSVLKQHKLLLTKSDDEKKSAIETVHRLEKELAEVSGEYRHQKDVVALRDEELKVLKRELESTQQQCVSSEKLTRSHEQMIGGLKDELKVASSKLASMQAAYNDLQQQFEIAKSGHKACLEEERQRSSQLSTNISSLEQRLERYERQNKEDPAQLNSGDKEAAMSNTALTRAKRIFSAQLEALREEKDRALQEEVQATKTALAAMEAMHRSELEKERERLRVVMETSMPGEEVDALCNQHMYELASLDIELQRMAQQYSAKCMELGALETRLSTQDKQLSALRSHVQQLLASNKTLSEDLQQQLVTLTTQAQDVKVVDMKDVEMQRLQQEIDTLKLQLATATDMLLEVEKVAPHIAVISV